MATRRKEGFSLARIGLGAGLILGASRAQEWSQPFNHNEPHNGIGSFTNPFVPWGQGLTSPIVNPPGTYTYVHPTVPFSITMGWPPPDPARNGRTFKAVHMALIPKGRYRGMVLVWDLWPMLLKHPPGVQPQPPALAAGDYIAFQPYAIIDPADVPTVTDPLPPPFGPQAFRYRNFLLPMPGVFTPDMENPGFDTVGLFCSGHTWTSFGDLVVVGGTDFDACLYAPAPPAAPPPLYTGTTRVAIWNPRLDSAPYPVPGNNQSLYPGFVGRWQTGGPGATLQRRRWYPTALLTHRLARTQTAVQPAGRETILVLGGSYDDDNSPAANTPWHNPTWNDYEALVVNAESNTFSTGLVNDVYQPLSGPPTLVWNGPGTITPFPVLPPVDVDWLEEYPRCHLMSDGQILFAGYAPRWALLNHETPGTWTSAAGQPPGTSYSSNWNLPRHDGSSILFPNFGGQTDVVVRLGGANDHWYVPAAQVFTTPTMESLTVGGSGEWQAGPPMPRTIPLPGDGGRYLMNVVILPTGAVAVFGGKHRNGAIGTEQNVYVPVVFENGGWTKHGANPVPSARDYHSTAVLLPDGRVFLGGGEGRDWDYEIWSPPYMSMGSQRPTNLQWQGAGPTLNPTFDAWEMSHGSQFTLHCDPLPLGNAVDRVVFMAPGSTTHHSDMHQRYVEMKTQVNNGNEVTFDVTDNERLLPRGLYMMFLVTNAAAISEAVWVMIP